MKHSKKILISIGVIIGYIVTIGTVFSNMVMYIKKKTDKQILEREVQEGRFTFEEVNSFPKEEIEITSPFGYQLKGWLVKITDEKKFIIISHGVTVNKLNSIKYMKIFLKLGWNVLIYDQRRHGESGGKTTSYGHYEKYDLKSVVDWLKTKYGEDCKLGIHGESMGAVTTLLYAGMIEDRAQFYIADCPFSDFEAQLRYRLKVEYKLPAFLVLPIANRFLKLRDGYSINDVSPISYVKDIKKPVLFIHSSEDDYILPEMTQELFNLKEGPKRLFIAPKGKHAHSYAENTEEYVEVIEEFIKEYTRD